MIYIYILLLTNNKYYVGRTSNPEFRIADHFDNKGSFWTKKYPPLKLLKLIPNCDKFDEDKYTKIYINKFGVDNVRGGSMCQIKIPKYQMDSLKKELDTIDDVCYHCGRNGHYANECYRLVKNDKPSKVDKPPIIKSKKKVYNTCYRCGRESHYADECYASKHIKGYYLD